MHVVGDAQLKSVVLLPIGRLTRHQIRATRQAGIQGKLSVLTTVCQLLLFAPPSCVNPVTELVAVTLEVHTAIIRLTEQLFEQRDNAGYMGTHLVVMCPSQTAELDVLKLILQVSSFTCLLIDTEHFDVDPV